VKVRSEVVKVEHVGSAHNDAELAVLFTVARERPHQGQLELDLGPLPEAVVSTNDVYGLGPPVRVGGIYAFQPSPMILLVTHHRQGLCAFIRGHGREPDDDGTGSAGGTDVTAT
jgi:hypothetical protein